MKHSEKFRVVYRFNLKPGQEERFIQAWARTTELFREFKEGALGSTLFRSPEDPSAVFAIASWQSYEYWKRSETKSSASQEILDEMKANIGKMKDSADFLTASAGNLVLDLSF